MRTSRLLGAALLIAGLVLGGCRYYWVKPEVTPETFARDNDACLQEARSASPATARYNIVNQEIYRACLTTRGYDRQKTTEGPGRFRGYEGDD